MEHAGYDWICNIGEQKASTRYVHAKRKPGTSPAKMKDGQRRETSTKDYVQKQGIIFRFLIL